MHFPSTAADDRRDGVAQPSSPAAKARKGSRPAPNRAKTSAAIRKGTIQIGKPTLVTDPNDEDFAFSRESARIYSVYEAANIHMGKPGLEQVANQLTMSKEDVGQAVTTSEPAKRSNTTGGLSTDKSAPLIAPDRSRVAKDVKRIRDNRESFKSTTSTVASSNRDPRKGKGFKGVLQRMFRRSTGKEPSPLAIERKESSRRPVARGAQVPEHHRSVSLKDSFNVCVRVTDTP